MIALTAEAEQQGWLGEAERLRVSLAAAEGKLAQLDERARRAATVHLGMPSFPDIAEAPPPSPTPGQEPRHDRARTDADQSADPDVAEQVRLHGHLTGVEGLEEVDEIRVAVLVERDGHDVVDDDRLRVLDHHQPHRRLSPSAVAAPFQLLIPMAQPGWLLWMAAFAYLVISCCVVVNNVTQVSFRQRLTPEKLLGRMNATVRFLVWGTTPIGALIGGMLGQLLGPRPTLWLAAIGAVIPVLPLILSPLRHMRELPTLSEREQLLD